MATLISTCSYAIESAGWRDFASVRQLEQVCFPKDAWPVWDIVGVLTLPNVVRLKAICGDQLVGFVAGDIRRSENLSWIATIGVLPEFRGQGIGLRLLTACEALLPTPAIRLCVRMTNDEAIRLYKNNGYHNFSVWDKYYTDGEAALVMEKKR